MNAGAPAARPITALEKTERRNARIADSVSNTTIDTIFNEKLGARDWKRVADFILRRLRTTSVEFLAALLYTGNIRAPITYQSAQVIVTDESGMVEINMPHVRQYAILALINNCISPTGLAMKVIEKCVFAGGRLGTNEASEAQADGPEQAWMLLCRRWADGTIAIRVGDQAKLLFGTMWPEHMGHDEFNEYYGDVC